MSKGNYKVNDSQNQANSQNDVSFRSCLCAILIFIGICVLMIVLASIRWSKPGGAGGSGDNLPAQDQLKGSGGKVTTEPSTAPSADSTTPPVKRKTTQQTTILLNKLTTLAVNKGPVTVIDKTTEKHFEHFITTGRTIVSTDKDVVVFNSSTGTPDKNQRIVLPVEDVTSKSTTTSELHASVTNHNEKQQIVIIGTRFGGGESEGENVTGAASEEISETTLEYSTYESTEITTILDNSPPRKNESVIIETRFGGGDSSKEKVKNKIYNQSTIEQTTFNSVLGSNQMTTATSGYSINPTTNGKHLVTINIISSNGTSKDKQLIEQGTTANNINIEETTTPTTGNKQVVNINVISSNETSKSNQSVEEGTTIGSTNTGGTTTSTIGNKQVVDINVISSNETSKSNQSVEEGTTIGGTNTGGTTSTIATTIGNKQVVNINVISSNETSKNNQSIEEGTTVDSTNIGGTTTSTIATTIGNKQVVNINVISSNETSKSNQSIEEGTTVGSTNTRGTTTSTIATTIGNKQVVNINVISSNETSKNNQSVEEGTTIGSTNTGGTTTSTIATTIGNKQVVNINVISSNETSKSNQSIEEGTTIGSTNTGGTTTSTIATTTGNKQVVNINVISSNETSKSDQSIEEGTTVGSTNTGGTTTSTIATTIGNKQVVNINVISSNETSKSNQSVEEGTTVGSTNTGRTTTSTIATTIGNKQVVNINVISSNETSKSNQSVEEGTTIGSTNTGGTTTSTIATTIGNKQVVNINVISSNETSKSDQSIEEGTTIGSTNTGGTTTSIIATTIGNKQVVNINVISANETSKSNQSVEEGTTVGSTNTGGTTTSIIATTIGNKQVVNINVISSNETSKSNQSIEEGTTVDNTNIGGTTTPMILTTIGSKHLLNVNVVNNNQSAVERTTVSIVATGNKTSEESVTTEIVDASDEDVDIGRGTTATIDTERDLDLENQTHKIESKSQLKDTHTNVIRETNQSRNSSNDVKNTATISTYVEEDYNTVAEFDGYTFEEDNKKSVSETTEDNLDKTNPKTNNEKHEKECKSKACASTISRMLSHMDHSIDFCDNFYQYSCGGVSVDDNEAYYDDIWSKFFRAIGNIDNGTSPNFLIKFKSFYNSCVVHEETFEYWKRLEAVKEIVNNAGKFIIDENIPVSKANLTKLLAKLVIMKSLPIMEVNIDVDVTTSEYVLQLTLPDKNLPSDEIDRWSTFFEVEKKCLAQNNYKFEDIVELEEVYKSYLECRTVYLSYINPVQSVIREMNFYAGLDAYNASQRMQRNLFSFDVDMLKITETENIANVRQKMLNKEYVQMEISDLQKSMDVIDWKLFFEELTGRKLQDEMPVQVYFYEKIKATMWQFQRMMLDKDKGGGLYNILLIIYATDIYQNTLIPKHKEDREEYCLKLSSRLFPDISSYLYFNFTSHNIMEHQKDIITNIFTILKDNLVHALTMSDWLDEDSKNSVVEKAERLGIHFASTSNRCFNDNELVEKYKSVEIGENFAKNLVTLIENRKKTLFGLAEKPFDEENIFCYSLQPFDIEPITLYAKEMIVVPYGVLRNIPDDVPGYVLMARVGVHLATQIARHFDPIGITHRMRLTEENQEIYRDNLVGQLKFKRSRVLDGQTIKFLTSNLTINQEIADNTALRMISDAYNKLANNINLPWVKNSFSNKQIFYISVAQEFCRKVSINEYMLDIYEREILPPPMRVEVMLVNSKDFSETFSCAEGSNMNGVEVTKMQFPYLLEEYEEDK